MTDYEILKSLVTPITDENREFADSLPKDSYSSLDLLEQCTYQYKFKYIDKFKPTKSSLAMECGTCLHKCLEIKGRNIIENKWTDYNELKEIALNGCEEITDKGNEKILGFNQLKRKYFDDYYVIDSNTGMNYEQKLQLFLDKVLPNRMEDKTWRIIGTEVPFEFIYDNRVVIRGFIDRIDANVITGDLKITDYKSSKKVFDEKKIKTPMQHFIYDLACVCLYNTLPVYHEYDFVLLNKLQTKEDGVCSKGYVNRGIKKLNKLLDLKDELIENNTWKPSPTPLCYWCYLSSNTPHSDNAYGGTCKYHSLWTPDNRTFEKLNEWNPDNVIVNEKKKEKRKLIF